jgi:tetratricopeptide (TPR) repeat protein
MLSWSNPIFTNRIIFLRKQVMKVEDRSDALREAVNFFDRYTDELRALTGDTFWTTLQEPFRAVIHDNDNAKLPASWSANQRILFGDLLIEALDGINTDHDAVWDEERWGRYVAEWDDPWELKKTHVMHGKLKQMFGNSNREDILRHVIDDFTYLTTHRANYLRGQACFHLGEWDKAAAEIKTFLDVINNPKTLKDIVTGAMSLQHSHWMLGVCYQNMGKYLECLESFAECKRITDDLMMGETMYILNMLTP